MPDRRTRVARGTLCIFGGVALAVLGAGTFVACSSSTSNGAKAGDASSEGAAGDAASDAPPCVVYDASGLDEATVAAGRAQVMSYRCQHCHQPMGLGGSLVLTGSVANVGDGGIVAYGPNLTPDPTTGLGCWTDPQVQRAILEGTDNTGATLCVMPQFAQQGMDAGTASEIVEFLRTLPAVVHQVPDTNCTPDAGAD